MSGVTCVRAMSGVTFPSEWLSCPSEWLFWVPELADFLTPDRLMTVWTVFFAVARNPWVFAYRMTAKSEEVILSKVGIIRDRF